MNATEHFQATDIEWDPTGRYVASQVSWWQQKVWGGGGKCEDSLAFFVDLEC